MGPLFDHNTAVIDVDGRRYPIEGLVTYEGTLHIFYVLKNKAAPGAPAIADTAMYVPLQEALDARRILTCKEQARQMRT